MAKQPRVWTGTQWDTLAVTLPDLSNYSTTTQADSKYATIANFPATAWTSYTPTLTNLTLGNGTLSARYIQMGKTVIVRFAFILGTTSSVSALPMFSLPSGITASSNQNWQPGPARYDDPGAGLYSGFTYFQDSSTVRFFTYMVSGSYIKENNVSSNTPFTFANGDGIYTTIVFEAN